MKKIMEFWKKLKYWQKGGVIGGVIASLYTSFLLYTMLYLENFLEKIYAVSPNIIDEFLDFNYIYFAYGTYFGIIHITNNDILRLVMFIFFNFIFGFLVGILIGFIIEKLKKK